MTKIELACHAAFADKRIRGEFFDVTFEEACAELDSHAEEIADALAEADQRYLDELDYFFNEFLPEYEQSRSNPTTCFEEAVTEIKRHFPTDADADLRREVDELKQTLAGIELTFKEMLEESRKQIAPAEKAAACLCMALTMPPSNERQRLLLQTANLLIGKNIF